MPKIQGLNPFQGANLSRPQSRQNPTADRNFARTSGPGDSFSSGPINMMQLAQQGRSELTATPSGVLQNDGQPIDENAITLIAGQATNQPLKSGGGKMIPPVDAPLSQQDPSLDPGTNGPIGGEVVPTQAELQAEFNRMAKGDNLISKQEFSAELSGNSQAEIDQIFQQLDKNKDGNLTFEEFSATNTIGTPGTSPGGTPGTSPAVAPIDNGGLNGTQQARQRAKAKKGGKAKNKNKAQNRQKPKAEAAK